MGKFPVIDMHCDLLSYLRNVPAANAVGTEIGCALPYLEAGNVKLQVLAIYTATKKGTVASAYEQSKIFKALPEKFGDHVVICNTLQNFSGVCGQSKTGIIASIENASGLCEEDEPVQNTFKNLEKIIENTGPLAYIGFTHHEENRFGGGNNSTAGLKDDGKKLLDYMSGKKIPVDFSHTSDALAYDILEHISKNNLEVPVIASHSNFRSVWKHARNLPNELVAEIVNRNGIIGMNFLRAFLHTDKYDALYDHILHGISIGTENAICLGADYFFTGTHPDQARIPFFVPELENAACYPAILEKISALSSEAFAEKISYKNVLEFYKRIWS
jgi:microsomal dipeptidase-like Zn-dependent dipeptidase